MIEREATAGGKGKIRGWLLCLLASVFMVGHLQDRTWLGVLFAFIMFALACPPIWARINGRFPSLGSTMRWVGVFVGFVGVIGLIPNDGSDSEGGKALAAAEPEASNDPLSLLRAKVDKNAIILMDAQNYRDTLKKLGQARFDEANDLTEWAALAAAESEDCRTVSVVGISDAATRDQLKWYVDCTPNERFKISESQALAIRDRLSADVPKEQLKHAEAVAVAKPASARWDNFDEPKAVAACDILTQSAMLVPKSFDSAWDWSTYKDDDTGIVTIQRDYKAENAYSQKINGRYQCKLNGDTMQIQELHIREPTGWRQLL